MFRNYDEAEQTLLKYVVALFSIPASSPAHKEIDAMQEYCAAKLIFESNTIEKAGLSEFHTRKVVEDHFPKIPYDYAAFKQAHFGDSVKNLYDPSMLEHLYQDQKINPQVIPSVSFADKSRSILEVAQHYTAYIDARAKALRYGQERLKWTLKQLLSANSNVPGNVQKLWEKLAEDAPSKPPVLLTEEKIRHLHSLLAGGLADPDWKVAPGNYRLDNRTAGFDVFFPSPTLIPGAMKEFIEYSHALMYGDEGIAITAAKISHRFVRIHPFPDFNGRLSRLIMAMVLHSSGIPFAPSIRADKKGRKRYFQAIKKANNGDFKYLALLIIESALQSFEDAEQNLVLSGLGDILHHLPTENLSRLMIEK